MGTVKGNISKETEKKKSETLVKIGMPDFF